MEDSFNLKFFFGKMGKAVSPYLQKSTVSESCCLKSCFTVLLEVENVLNNHPLYLITVDDVSEVLTPKCFLY